MKRDPGNIANIMITGIFILAMTAIMMSFMDDMQLVQQKMEINQIARNGILRMETVGYLSSEDQMVMRQELEKQGVTDLDLGGTTMNEVGYGEKITLEIRGLLGGKYAFEEKRVSTAKH